MKIYTKTGDDGTTALFRGKRILKCEELVDVYGSIDELNSWIGVIAAQLKTPEVRHFGEVIQQDLYTISSLLAGWTGEHNELVTRVSEMEARIDAMEKELPQLNHFIMPGGSTLGSFIHVARAIARRTERQAVGLFHRQNSEFRMQSSDIEKLIIRYLNRLSDLLFILARFVNKQENIQEIIWCKHKKDHT